MSPEAELIQRCVALDAGTMRATFFDRNDVPIAMVVTVVEVDDCIALAAFLDQLEEGR